MRAIAVNNLVEVSGGISTCLFEQGTVCLVKLTDSHLQVSTSIAVPVIAAGLLLKTMYDCYYSNGKVDNTSPTINIPINVENLASVFTK